MKFINGQVTNEVAGLKPGQGCYAALVNAKAKMQADLHVYRLDDELILDFEPGLLDTVKGENLDIDGLVETATVYALAAAHVCGTTEGSE